MVMMIDIVLYREISENELLFPNWLDAMKGLEACQESKGVEKVWVIGGSAIYKVT